MHSFWQRLNALFFYALSVLGFLSFMGAGTTYWHVSDPTVELTLERILLRKIYGAGHDQAILSLGIDADLRSVFNWNVKQLFVYVTAEYETDANVLNQVVVWDSIINDQVHRLLIVVHPLPPSQWFTPSPRGTRSSTTRRRRGYGPTRWSTSTR